MCARTRPSTIGRPIGIPGARSSACYPDDTVGDDGLLGVDVTQKGIQGSCALPQACRQVCPFVGGDEPRHQIEGKHLSAALPADPEHDVLGALILFDTALAGPQHGHPETGNGLQDLLVCGLGRPSVSTASS